MFYNIFKNWIQDVYLTSTYQSDKYQVEILYSLVIFRIGLFTLGVCHDGDIDLL